MSSIPLVCISILANLAVLLLRVYRYMPLLTYFVSRAYQVYPAEWVLMGQSMQKLHLLMHARALELAV